MELPAWAETINISTSGVNGLDTGTAANGYWYYFFTIAKTDGTQDLIASLSPTAPTLPSGYTYYSYFLGACYYTSNAFKLIWQIDNKVAGPNSGATMLNAGAATSITSFTFPTCVPPEAKKVWCTLYSPSASCTGGIYITAANTFQYSFVFTAAGYLSGVQSYLLTTPQTLWYYVNSSTVSIYSNGWEY
jgi:hypothetical protein